MRPRDGQRRIRCIAPWAWRWFPTTDMEDCRSKILARSWRLRWWCFEWFVCWVVCGDGWTIDRQSLCGDPHLGRWVHWRRSSRAWDRVSWAKRWKRMSRRRRFLQRQRMQRDVRRMSSSCQQSNEEPILPWLWCRELIIRKRYFRGNVLVSIASKRYVRWLGSLM